jgi:hypothetical protein
MLVPLSFNPHVFDDEDGEEEAVITSEQSDFCSNRSAVNAE